MATNIKHYGAGIPLSVTVSNPTTPTSGAPVRYGAMTGLALTDEGDGGNEISQTSVEFGVFVAELPVDDTSGTGIAEGAAIYYDDTATGTPATNLNDDSANGVLFGYALAPVAANDTATIRVLHVLG